MSDLRRIFENTRRNPGYCLVIRPMKPEFDRFWADVARAYKRTFAWTDVGQLESSGDIMDEVLHAMARSDVIIADVSEGSPNVFYELGIAHAMKTLGKVVIVTRVKGHEPTALDVPFDVRGLRFLRYDPDAGVDALVPALREMLFDALEGTTWFHLTTGATHRSPLIAGDDGNYRFEVTALAITGDERLKNEAVDVELTLHKEPPDGDASQRHRVRLLYRDETRRTFRIPHLPWRLRSEGHERGSGELEAVICMVPDGE